MHIGFDQHGPSVHLLKEIIKRCLDRGHTVYMIVRNRGGSDPNIPIELQGYSNLHCDVIYDSKLDKGALVKRYFEDVRYTRRCKEKYKQYDEIDAVFLQSTTTPLFDFLNMKNTIKAPVLFNVQNIFPIDAGVLQKLPTKGIKSLPYHIFRKMQQMAYKKSDLIVTISEDMRHTLIKEKVPVEKLKVIYNWSYGDEEVVISDKDNLFLNDHPEFLHKFRVVFAGNLGAMVNPRIFADAALQLKEYSDIQFIIIGDGNNMHKLKELANQYELTNMSFYPYQPVEYARHNYAMAHVNINALPKGIITTCLPSKTATMLNSARPMVVAVESESEYAKILKEVDKCQVVNWDDTVGFVQAIKHYYLSQDTSDSNNSRDVFRKYFSVANASKYVDLLEEIGLQQDSYNV